MEGEMRIEKLWKKIMGSIFLVREDLQLYPESGNEAESFAAFSTAAAAAAASAYVEELNKEGYSQLHLACRDGNLTTAKRIIQTSNGKSCFVKDKDGKTPLHTAVMKGKLDFIKAIMDACPEAVNGVVTVTGETCLHTAVLYNKGKSVQYLLKWLSQSTAHNYLINAQDHDGNTALHLATSRKQLQSLKVFLSCDLVEVNAVNYGGFTALDILYVLPYGGKIDMEIDKILRRAGALRARDLGNQESSRVAVCDPQRERWKPTQTNSIKTRRDLAYDVLLLIAALLATITFQAASIYPCSIFKADSVIKVTFILLNSTGFVASVATIIFLLHEFPLKPWPQISVSTLFGSYMCLIMQISPREAMPLLILSIPFLLLAAVGKLFWFPLSR